jgi:hypothetical protein
MASEAPHYGAGDASIPRQQLMRWQVSRTWARLIREAEALWQVDVPSLRRLAAGELGVLLQEVPPLLRGRVNRWLACFGVRTRLSPCLLEQRDTKKPAGEAGGEGKD